MKMKTFYFALFAALITLCSCGNNEKFVGIWESEDFVEDGSNVNFVYTFFEDGSMTMDINVIGTTVEEGIKMRMEFTVSVLGDWYSSIDMLKLDLDESSVDVEINDIVADDELATVQLYDMLDDPETNKIFVDQIKKEFDISDFSGSYDVESINATTMKIRGKDGSTITFKRI